MQTKFKIGLLATGDEIIVGDILNTNAKKMAEQLTDEGYWVGNHIVASDTLIDIEQAINFLLQEHAIIIITGGLGPTSDDRTRFALANVIQKPLYFDENSWNHIVTRFKNLQLPLDDSNRQQAFFPEGAQIIPNLNGTASGCCINYQNKGIFLLPGPPKECFPMFETSVLPIIRQKFGKSQRQIIKWRLFNVLEASIAAQVEPLIKNTPFILGYRIDYPYLEVKLYIENTLGLDDVLVQINQLLLPYQLDLNNRKASQLLMEYLKNYSGIISIHDMATVGFLESQLRLPSLYNKLIFNTLPNTSDIQVKIRGLDELWIEGRGSRETKIMLEFQTKTKSACIEKKIPLRAYPAPLTFAVECIAWEIYQFITTHC